MLEDLLTEGLRDCVDLPWIAQEVTRISTSWDSEARTSVGLGLVAMAIYQGLMVPGDMTATGFQPWGLPDAEGFERVARAWLEIGIDELLPGNVGWMGNTPLGDAIARAVIDREGSDRATEPSDGGG